MSDYHEIPFPDHLREDASFQVCDTCGRHTWSTDEFNSPCLFPQPNGTICSGAFGVIRNADDPPEEPRLNETRDFRVEADRLMLVGQFLDGIDLEFIQANVTRADTLGPLLEPTKYRDALQSGDMHAVADLAGALVAAQDIYRRKIKPKVPPA